MITQSRRSRGAGGRRSDTRAANDDVKQALALKQRIDDYTRQAFSLADCEMAPPH